MLRGVGGSGAYGVGGVRAERGGAVLLRGVCVLLLGVKGALRRGVGTG